jgi:hypothetical protein
MRFGLPVVPLLFLTLATPGQTGEPKSRKPRLDLRATPRVALSPVNVLLVAELVGGDELEDFYCPGLEWEWGDGAKSAYESDCPPFEPGAEFTRRFSASHAYNRPGDYQVTVRLRRADRSLAAATASITVRGLSASYE